VVEGMADIPEIRALWAKYDRCKAQGSFKRMTLEELRSLESALEQAWNASLPFPQAETATLWFVTHRNEITDLIFRRENPL